jgi:hypothetical protein
MTIDDFWPPAYEARAREHADDFGVTVTPPHNARASEQGAA